MASPEIVLPSGCVLNPFQKEVFYGTYQKGELPCMGCFLRKTCPARVDGEVRTAHALMDEPLPPARICQRCKAPIVEWKITDSFRRWECTGKLEDSETPCGWYLSEYGASNRAFQS